ncbi:hypothetical protein CYQ88_05710 [Hydrogenovibrio sp. SC-1]|uniref:hypothetical protein n=1 Tax=Hydrogenovibrio sp. SC-1 TaxID=2065820 RepID=UPI000C7CDA66|nr:hypothetical protein [Hydrogenovibrio sp. SC-1]PLA74576.1 hypothetical protein CYQ88_05710 [Hydrogenovibrio sp. SC-1]
MGLSRGALLFISLTALLLLGCEADKETWPAETSNTADTTSATDTSETGTTTGDTTAEIKSLTITAVDPYISEAQFCIDTNKNGSCDQGTDPYSTEDTDNPGQYTFQDYTPTTDLPILTVKAGMHNGKDYALELKGTVTANSETAVINPATTATHDKGVTGAEWVAILNQFSDQFGTVLTEADLTVDPLADLYDQDHAELSSANISRLRMQMTSYAILRILQSTQSFRDLTGTTLIASATSGEGDGDSEDKLYKIMEQLSEAANKAVDPAAFTLFLNDTAYTNIPITVRPALTTKDFSATAMTLIDHITELAYKQSSTHAGNLTAIIDIITPELVHIVSRTTQIAKRYFAANHQAEFAEDTKLNRDVLSVMNDDSHMKEGINCTSGYFEINTDSKMLCIETTATTTIP